MKQFLFVFIIFSVIEQFGILVAFPQGPFQDFNPSDIPIQPQQGGNRRYGPIMPVGFGGYRNPGYPGANLPQIHPYIAQQAQQQQFFNRAPLPEEFYMQQNRRGQFPIRPSGPQMIQPFANYGAFGPNQQQSQFFAQNKEQQTGRNNIPLEVVHGRLMDGEYGSSGPIGAGDFPTQAAGVSAFQAENYNVDSSGKEPELGWKVQVKPMDDKSNLAKDNTNSELPKFLQGSSQEIIDEYKRIIRTPNRTYSDQVKEIETLVVRKLDAEHQQFMQENDEREQKHRDRIHRTVSQMSDKAQEQFAKVFIQL